MPFDPNGAFTRTYTWATEALNPPIAVSKLDTQEEDIADALSNAILRDGTGKPTADVDWNGKRLTNLAAATASTDAVSRTFGDSRYGVNLREYKASNESVTSSATLQNDDDLVLSVEANTVYAFEMYLYVNSAGAGGFRQNWTLPSGATGHCQIIYNSSTTPASIRRSTITGTDFTITAGSATEYVLHYVGVIAVSGTAGSVQLQWAQETSNGSATSINAYSWLELRKLS